MSRYESPSPTRCLYEAAPTRRRGRGADAGVSRGHRRQRADSRSAADDEFYGERGAYNGGGGRASRSRSARRPPVTLDPARSRSPRRSVRGRRELPPAPAADADLSYSDDDFSEPEAPPRLRGVPSSRAGGPSSRRGQVESASGHGSSRKTAESGRGREADKKSRRRKDRERERARAFAAQQVPMQMAMMQGMMGLPPAMQMAMMQQRMGFPSPFMPNAMRPKRSRKSAEERGAGRSRRRDAASDPEEEAAAASRRGSRGVAPSRAPEGAADAGSSSSSSDSSDESDGRAPVMPAAAMAAMAAMWPGALLMPMMPPAPGRHIASSVEALLASCAVDAEAADRVRALPPPLQQMVLQRGPIAHERNPSAALLARIREAEMQQRVQPALGAGYAPPGAGALAHGDEHTPARKSAKMTIETLIKEYKLSAGCAWMLRALPPDKQKLAARIDPSGQDDPSAYVAEQMHNIV
eukprot:TRINITY_DN16841_c2_g2_i1.p1 TRINITY_DN16841_c2_g2~~TRINITY_DN16841_c2_g2_i1.p1  ORF type:complete len:467 (+),score=108.43 TRINITY_DN16841_c2_g2_i1:137-1537(+)